jgi:hypothetical protein
VGDIKPTAFFHEKPTPSNPKLLYRHVSFFGSIEQGDQPLYTLEQAAEILGVTLPDKKQAT